MVDIREVPEADIDRAQELAYLVFHDRPEEEARRRHHRLLSGCDRLGAYDGRALVGFMAAHPSASRSPEPTSTAPDSPSSPSPPPTGAGASSPR